MGSVKMFDVSNGALSGGGAARQKPSSTIRGFP